MSEQLIEELENILIPYALERFNPNNIPMMNIYASVNRALILERLQKYSQQNDAKIKTIVNNLKKLEKSWGFERKKTV